MGKTTPHATYVPTDPIDQNVHFPLTHLKYRTLQVRGPRAYLLKNRLSTEINRWALV